MTPVRPALTRWFLSPLPSQRRQILYPVALKSGWWGGRELLQGSTPSTINWSLLVHQGLSLLSPRRNVCLWFARRLAVKSEADYWSKGGSDTTRDALWHLCSSPGCRLMGAAKNHYSALASEPGNHNKKTSITFCKTVCGCPQLFQWAGLYPSC